MLFTELKLDPAILKSLQTLNYKTPTPIQAKSIPHILRGEDVMASAQTGTGKTAAFILPSLHKLTLKKSNKPRVLVLTPTRELAAQVAKAAHQYGKFLKFKTVSLLGGMSYKQQIRDLSKQVDLVIATPGRLLDHAENKRIDLSHIEVFVLDEADRMLDMGFIDDVKKIAKFLPPKRQTLLFSATLNDRLLKAIQHMLKNPARIEFAENSLAPKIIKQEVYFANDVSHKQRLLDYFVANGNMYKAIIFSATKKNADKIAKQLRDDGFNALALHGDLKQNLRMKTVQSLKSGNTQFLVATDVAGRGIDINDLTHVINYDLPRFSEDYVHRIGRTGRAGKEGKAISFVLPSDLRHLRQIEKLIDEKIAVKEIEGLEPSKKFADKADTAHKTKGHKKSFGKKSYSKKSFGTKSFDKKAKPKHKKDFEPKQNNKSKKSTSSHHDKSTSSYRDKSTSQRDKSPSSQRASGWTSSQRASGWDQKSKSHSSSEQDSSWKPKSKSHASSWKPKSKANASSKPASSWKPKSKANASSKPASSWKPKSKANASSQHASGWKQKSKANTSKKRFSSPR